MILVSWFKIISFIVIIIMGTILSIPSDSKLGIIYFKSYQYDKALKYLTQAKTDNKNSPIILKKLKDYFLIQGELDKALKTQEKITKILPKNIFHWKELARLYNWNNQPYLNLKSREKLLDFQRGSIKNNNLLDIFNGYRWLKKEKDARRIANMLYATNQSKYLEAALDYFLSVQDEKEVVRFISKIESLENKGHHYKLQMARAYELQKDLENALVNYLNYFLNLDLNEYDLLLKEFLLAPKELFTKRMDIVEKVIELTQKLEKQEILANLYSRLYHYFPTQYDRGLDAAQIFIKYGQTDRAYKLLGKISSVRSAKRQYRAANLYLLMDNELKAIKSLQRAIKLYPFKEIYYQDLSYLYEKTGQKKKALQVQLKLLKILNDKQSKNFINDSELLYAGKTTEYPKESKNQLIKTKFKILNLLYELGDEQKRFEKLQQFYLENPNNYKLKKMLAYQYLSRKQNKKAIVLFKELYTQNIYDKDVSLFMADHYLAQNQYIKALNILKPFAHLTNENDIQNRLHLISAQTTPQKALRNCENFSKDFKDFNLLEIQMRCLKLKNNKNQLITLIKKELIQRKNKGEKDQLTQKLFYLYLEKKKMDEAKSLLTTISSKVPPKNYEQLKTDYQLVLNEKIRQNSWEHYGAAQLLKFDQAIQITNFGLIKNIHPFYIGFENQHSKFEHIGQDIGQNNFILGKKYNQSQYTFSLGQNYGHTDLNPYSLRAQYYPNTNFYFNAFYQKNKQINQIPGLIRTNSYRENFNLYSDIKFSAEQRIELFAQQSQFHLKNNTAMNQDYMIHYYHNLNPSLTFGLFNYYTYVLNGDQQIRDRLLESSHVLALTAGSTMHWLPFIKNRIDFFIGQDQKRNLNFGQYQRIRVQNFYTKQAGKEIQLNLEWNKESLQINENESFSIQINYNFWIKNE